MSFKIISSNIRFDNPKDAQHAWAGRRNILAKNLLSFSPDLIATQEGRRPQLLDFHSLLPGFSMADDHREWIAERMYPTIYFNRDRVNILKSGDIWLSKTPQLPGSKSFNSMFPRLCTWAIFQLIDHTQKILLLNVHLDHSTDDTRESQINVLIEEVDKVNNQSLPIILLGDFNSLPESPVRKQLSIKWPQLIDHWLLFNETDAPTHHNFGEYADYAGRIDWILLDNNFVPVELFADKAHDEGIYPSDHYPVKCKVEIRPN